MADTTYQRSVASDFTGLLVQKPSMSQLAKEIGDSAISVAYRYGMLSGDDVTLVFADALATAEETLLDQIIAAHTGLGLVATSTDAGIPKVYVEGGVIQPVSPEGTELVAPTHNFCDPTTWFAESARVTETLVDTGSGLTFQSPTGKVSWICLVAGKYYNEDNPAYVDRSLYAVDVKVNGATQTIRSPFADTWGGEDCVIDYAAGTVTFQSAPAAPPTVTFSYAQGSGWYLPAPEGKTLRVEDGEVQFSTDVVYTDDLVMEYVSLVNGSWVVLSDPATGIPLVQRYSTPHQLIDDARGAYTQIPVISGSTGRSMLNPMYGFPFRYGRARNVLASQNMAIRIRTESNKAFGGERATGTLYCSLADG